MDVDGDLNENEIIFCQHQHDDGKLEDSQDSQDSWPAHQEEQREGLSYKAFSMTTKYVSFQSDVDPSLTESSDYDMDSQYRIQDDPDYVHSNNGHRRSLVNIKIPSNSESQLGCQDHNHNSQMQHPQHRSYHLSKNRSGQLSKDRSLSFHSIDNMRGPIDLFTDSTSAGRYFTDALSERAGPANASGTGPLQQPLVAAHQDALNRTRSCQDISSALNSFNYLDDHLSMGRNFRGDMRSSDNIIREDMREEDLSDNYYSDDCSNSKSYVAKYQMLTGFDSNHETNEFDLASPSRLDSPVSVEGYSIDNLHSHTTQEETTDKNCDEENIEDAICEKELREFAKEMNMPITKDLESRELDYLSSMAAITSFLTIMGAEVEDSPRLKMSKVLTRLKDSTKERRDGTWTLSIKDKKLGAELVMDCLNLFVDGHIKEAVGVATEARKKSEKEYQNGGDGVKDKLSCIRHILFTDVITISYDKSRDVIVPSYLMTDRQKREIFNSIQKNISRAQIALARKKTDTLKRRGHKSKDNNPEIWLDNLCRSVYPLMSICSNLSNPYTFLQRYSRLDVRVDIEYLPVNEEGCAFLPVGKYLVRNAWTNDSDDDKVVDFLPVYIFLWKSKTSIFLRSKTTLYEVPNISKGHILKLCLSFDDEYDIYQMTLLTLDMDIVGKVKTLAFTRRSLMEEAQGGLMDTQVYTEIKKYNLFYLSTVFGLRLDITDGESRNLVHYAAWIGSSEVVKLLLVLAPHLANQQDEYQETPLMLAVKGGRDCLSCLRILLQSSDPKLINKRNQFGQTALHLSTLGTEFAVTEALIKAGANASIKDFRGKLAIDLVESTNTNRKATLSLLRKFSR